MRIEKGYDLIAGQSAWTRAANLFPAVPRRRVSQVTPWRFLSLPFLLFLVLPLVALLIRTPPANLLAKMGDSQVIHAVGLSMATTTLTTVVTVIFGTPVAYMMSHRDSRFHRVIDTLVDLPTVLPPAVAGVALLMAFGRRGLVGSTLVDMGIDIAFTQVAVVMAQVFVASPFYIKAAAIGFANIDSELKQVAALDGANGWQVFWYVVLPIAWSALVSGGVMTWARALGEFGATIIFAGNFPGRTQTMPLAIYIGFELDMHVALTLSVILVASSFLVLMVVKALLRYGACPQGRS